MFFITPSLGSLRRKAIRKAKRQNRKKRRCFSQDLLITTLILAAWCATVSFLPKTASFREEITALILSEERAEGISTIVWWVPWGKLTGWPVLQKTGIKIPVVIRISVEKTQETVNTREDGHLLRSEERSAAYATAEARLLFGKTVIRLTLSDETTVSYCLSP